MAPKTNKKAAEKKEKDQKSLEKELSTLDQNALELWRKKDKERVGPPKFKKIKDRAVTQVEQDPEKFWPQVMETTGSTDRDFFKILLDQISATLPDGDTEEVPNFNAALMHGLMPRDETEGILIAQMTGTHNLIMEYMRRAILPKQFLEAANDYTNMVCKLMNIFLKQIETLEKYRGKTTQQKVIVEHVNIHEGGQAVVGNIESKPRGEGDEPER